MAKSNKAVKIVKAVAPAPVVKVANTQAFKVLAPKRPLTLTCLVKGVKQSYSNAETHQALYNAAAKHGGALTASQAQAICMSHGHKGFYTYAINKLRILAAT